MNIEKIVYRGKTYTIDDVPPSFLNKSDPLKAWVDKKEYYVKNRKKKSLYEKDRRRNTDFTKRKAEYCKQWRKDNPDYKAPNDKMSKDKYRNSTKGKKTEAEYRKKPSTKASHEKSKAKWHFKNPDYYKNHSRKPEVMARRRELDNIRSKKDSIKKSLRTLLYNSLTRYTDEGKVHQSSKYGIDYNKCILKLEQEAKSYGYTTEEMRKMNYHIDHIIPISEYNLKNKKDIARCFSPLNLRWLPARENIVKGNHIRPQDLEIIKTLPESIYPKGKKIWDLLKVNLSRNTT